MYNLKKTEFLLSYFSDLDVDVSDEVVTEVVANVHLLDLAVLVLCLDEHVLKEVVVMFL